MDACIWKLGGNCWVSWWFVYQFCPRFTCEIDVDLTKICVGLADFLWFMFIFFPAFYLRTRYGLECGVGPCWFFGWLMSRFSPVSCLRSRYTLHLKTAWKLLGLLEVDFSIISRVLPANSIWIWCWVGLVYIFSSWLLIANSTWIWKLGWTCCLFGGWCLFSPPAF